MSTPLLLPERWPTWGRERLLADACDPRKLLASSNEAARKQAAKGETPVLWSDDLLRAIGASRP